MNPAPMPVQARGPGPSPKRSALRVITALLWALVLVGLALLVLLLSVPACAAERPVQVPAVATVYRLKVEREAAANFGLQAPAARLAAQIHQESAWNPKAASAYAHGLTQFTPATTNWLPSICPAVGKPDAWDPDWSLRAQACYMAWLYGRVQPFKGAPSMTACTRWNFALRGYNGGEGWLNKERTASLRAGANPNDWRQVEQHRVRAGWAHRENIGYPRRILLVLEPAYLAAGWSGQAVCA